MNDHWTLATDAEGIAWLRFDQRNSTANTLSEETLAELDRTEQVMVIGEGRPYLAALVVLDPDALAAARAKLELDGKAEGLYEDPRLLRHVLHAIQERLTEFPGYAKIHRVGLVEAPWTVVNGMMTPTLKLKRNRILEHHGRLVEQLYAGH